MKEDIVTIIPSLYEGGAEKFAADLSLRLDGTFNHKTVVYNPTAHRYDHAGEVIELDVPPRSTPLGRFVRQLRIVKQLKRLKQQWSPKVVISHMLMANMLNVLSRKNERTVCVLHGEWSIKTGGSWLLRRFVRRQYQKADQIVSVSHYIKEMFDSHYQLDVPHEVIYVGLPVETILREALQPPHVSLPNSYMVYVAGFRPVKNHLALIDALEVYLKLNPISLVLLGDGPLRSEIEDRVKSLGLSEKVLLLGNVPNPYPIVKGATLSLMVSESESFSLVVVESMILGVPVIATDCGGPREILAPDWNEQVSLPYQSPYGKLIDKPDQWKPDSLSQWIDDLLKDKQACANVVSNARQRAEAFSIRHSEERYKALLRRLIQKNG
ncbi:MAG: glycosyltransferase [Bacteroidota bacterium]